MDKDMSENEDINGQLNRRVFSEQIKDQLIDDILNKNYLPGERLIESALAKKFGVSQAPVREALKSLAEMGFVTIESYKGTSVRKLTKEEIWEMLSIRAVLESFAAGICAQKITSEDINTLEEYILQMIRAAETGNAEERMRYNHMFHQKIIQVSGHKLVNKLSGSLRFASWSHTTGVLTDMDSLEIAKRHRAIMEPIKAHDPVTAEKAMREHILSNLDSLLKGLETDEEL